ncbi:hypothetical protein Tco_0163370 [Tanacetum coccineum]
MIRVPVTIKILVITNLHSILRVIHNSLTVVSSVEVHIIAHIVKQEIHPSLIRVLVTIKTLVMTNLHFILRITNNSLTVVRSVEVPIIALIVKPGTSLFMSLLLDLDSESHFMRSHRDTNRILEELLRTLKPNSPAGEPEGSENYTEVTYDKEQYLSDHYTAHVTPPVSPSIPFLATMEPLETFLMGDEVISTILERKNDKFIKSSVDDLVPIHMVDSHCYDDDDDYTIAITPVLPTKEPDKLAFRMGDEHLGTLFGNGIDELFKEHSEISSFNNDSSSCDASASYENIYYVDVSPLDAEIFRSIPFPPADRSDFHHEEFAGELTHIISPSEYDHFYFRLCPELMAILLWCGDDIYHNKRTKKFHVPNVYHPSHPGYGFHTFKMSRIFEASRAICPSITRASQSSASFGNPDILILSTNVYL